MNAPPPIAERTWTCSDNRTRLTMPSGWTPVSEPLPESCILDMHNQGNVARMMVYSEVWQEDLRSFTRSALKSFAGRCVPNTFHIDAAAPWPGLENRGWVMAVTLTVPPDTPVKESYAILVHGGTAYQVYAFCDPPQFLGLQATFLKMIASLAGNFTADVRPIPLEILQTDAARRQAQALGSPTGALRARGTLEAEQLLRQLTELNSKYDSRQQVARCGSLAMAAVVLAVLWAKVAWWAGLLGGTIVFGILAMVIFQYLGRATAERGEQCLALCRSLRLSHEEVTDLMEDFPEVKSVWDERWSKYYVLPSDEHSSMGGE